MTPTNTEKDMQAVADGLTRAKECGLEAEVILSAMYAIRFDKNITIAGAINEALYEWDC